MTHTFKANHALWRDILQSNLLLKQNNTLYKRHPDDAKFYHDENRKNHQHEIATNEDDQLKKWHKFCNTAPPYYKDYDSDDVENNNPWYEADNSTLTRRSTCDKITKPTLLWWNLWRLDMKWMDKDLCHVIIDNSMTLTLYIYTHGKFFFFRLIGCGANNL